MRRAKLALGGALVAGVLAVPLQATAAKAPTPVVVKVTIIGHPIPTIPGKLIFSPVSAKRGRVVFKITNRDDEFHSFEINGVVSRAMGPHRGQAVMRVNFKKRGVYNATVPDDNQSGIGGVFKIT